MMKNRIKLICIALLLIFFSSVQKNITFGQNVSVSASLDSTLMFIGGQMNFYLEVIQPEGLDVKIPFFSDTITKNIEVVRYSRPDTVRSDNVINVMRLYRITSFDSGLHYIPPIEVEYIIGEMLETQASRSLGLLVINPFEEVDPEKGFFDIKSPYTLPFSFLEIIKYLNWIFLFMLISSILAAPIYIWLFKKRNPIKEIFFREKPKEPPHVVALRELIKIKNEKIWQKGLIKQYYSQLTDTIRTYMEGRFGFPAMEQITPEILQALKNVDLPNEKLISGMEIVLEIADLAKFAKFEPLPDENNNCLIEAFNFVEETMPESTSANNSEVVENAQEAKDINDNNSLNI